MTAPLPSTAIADKLAEALRFVCQREPTDEALTALAEYDAHRKPASQMADGELLVEIATPSSVDEAVDTLDRVYASGASAQLAQVVRTLIGGLDRLGFNNPDGPVSGGDCVELIGELLPNLRRAVAAHGGELLAAENDVAGERKRLIDFLIRDWESSFAEDVDSTFGAVVTLLREGHAGYGHMPIAELRRQAEDAGYDEDLEDEPQGMSP